MTTHIVLPVHPIETAPRDGTWVLLWGGPLVKPEIGQWTPAVSGHPAVWFSNAGTHHAPFTHWSPLPDLSAPADPEALAGVLREMGWVCVPPDPKRVNGMATEFQAAAAAVSAHFRDIALAVEAMAERLRQTRPTDAWSRL